MLSNRHHYPQPGRPPYQPGRPPVNPPYHPPAQPGMRLAHAYVPWQTYDTVYSPQEALNRGTLFPELYLAIPPMGKV